MDDVAGLNCFKHSHPGDRISSARTARHSKGERAMQASPLVFRAELQLALRSPIDMLTESEQTSQSFQCDLESI